MRHSYPRKISTRSTPKPHTIIFVAVIIVLGAATAFFFAQSQQQSATISSQLQEISSLTEDLENKSSVISTQGSEISELRDLVKELSVQVGDLSGRLGIAAEELSELTPKVSTYYVVGVRSDGEGVVVPVEVKITKGSGALSTNINNVEFLSGTQTSIRIAADVASGYSRVSRSDRDITVSLINLHEETVTVDGGSAGAAITVAIIAALLEKQTSTDALITGTIEPSGMIGRVGSITAKADAARKFGARTFLVPRFTSVDISGIELIEISEIDEAVQRIIL